MCISEGGSEGNIAGKREVLVDDVFDADVH
jgi:hypothetical protein